MIYQDISEHINSPLELLFEKRLEICSKFTGEHPCESVISIILLCCIICFPVNLLYIYRSVFIKILLGQLLSISIAKVTQAMFTLCRIAFRVGLKMYRIVLLFTLKHDNFGMILIYDSYCDAAVLKVIRYVSDSFSMHSKPC